jgi:hypothetical protein
VAAAVCDQIPGEVIFVPDGFQHGVLNLETSVGIAMEVGSDMSHVER